MSKRYLVQAYLRGKIDRRQFIKGLRVVGVSAAAAVAYAQLVGSETVSGVTRDAAGFFVADLNVADYHACAGVLTGAEHSNGANVVGVGNACEHNPGRSQH